MLDKAFLEEMKEKLLAEQTEIEDKLQELLAPEQGMDNPDMDDLSNDAQEDILQDSLEETYKKTLNKVKAALQRIEEGTYGLDIDTGKPIAEERLRIEPTAEKAV